MVVGQSYSANWSSSNASSISYSCSNGSGLVASGSSNNASGSFGGTALAGWVTDPPACTFTATGNGGTASATDRLVTNAAPPPPGLPTISVTRTPAVMTSGESYTLTWSSSNATNLTRVCTSTGSGFVDNSNQAISGSVTSVASAAWIGARSTCTWTATASNGAKATFSETMITQPAMASTRTVTYVHTDTLGSPVAKTNASGAVLARTRYEPYGAVAQGATPTIGFTGHVNDADTGLTYMQQRYYDTLAGRFLSADPILTNSNGNGFNRYVYAENNPYKYKDPDGRNPVALGRLVFSVSFEGAKSLGAPVIGAAIGSAIFYLTHGPNDPNAPLQNSGGDGKASGSTTGGLSGDGKVTTSPGTSNPMTGEPGSCSTCNNVKGDRKQDRFYGSDGYPAKDIDYDHDHKNDSGDKMGKPHVHDWTRPADGGRPTNEDRLPARPPTPEEKK
jgi:RHS repeat-associated protein